MNRLGKVLIGVALVLLAAFLIFRTPDTDPAAMRGKYGGAPSQFVALGNGLTVHLRDEGPRDAPAIVLLHGSNADLHTWDGWAAALSGKYRVIRFDQIGHGLTGPNPSGDYSPAAFTRTVQAVADKLGLNQFVLAGNSMGGGIAVDYALTHPERLTGLVLVDAGGAPRTTPAKGIIGFTIARTPGLNLLMRAITPRSLIDKSVRQTVGDSQMVTPAMVDRYWELLRYPGNRAATATRFAAPMLRFAPQQLAAIKVPVLILWGAKDGLIPVAAAEWYHRALPQSQAIVYPQLGHIPMEEAPARTAADLSAWLAAHPAPRVDAAAAFP
jgi:pimeloyl-ACP methyl ester carboxylesterase